MRSIKQKIGLTCYLSKINTLDDQKEEKDFQFSHFATHGFRQQDWQLVQKLIRNNKACKVFDGFVFLVPADGKPFSDIRAVSKFITDEKTRALIHLKLPRNGEGAAFEDEETIANVVAESVVSACGLSDVSLFLDTFVHHDRGYYPRNGLIDRRYNPRLAYYIMKHLGWALPEYKDGLKIEAIAGDQHCRAFLIESLSDKMILVLLKKKTDRVAVGMPPHAKNMDNVNWLSLYTGRVEKGVRTKAGKKRIVFALPTKTQHPGLLIFDNRQ